MTNPSSIQHPDESGGVGGIGRLIRQICLLREQADPVRARLRENELAEAVRGFRAAQGAEALPESELQAMFAVEERRVAEAVILSELLLPQLVLSLPASSRPAPLAARSAPGAAAQPAVPRPDKGAPEIPDLLDAMLAAERTSPRTRR